MKYLKFFFGTPKRLLASLIAIGVLLSIIFPEALAMGLKRLSASIMDAFGPLIGIGLTILIVFAGLRIILGHKK